MMTSKERFSRILQHKPVDRVGLFEVGTPGRSAPAISGS
jgi:hypothetical protein